MKLYKIYIKKSKSGKEIEDVILINEGLNLKAFFLTFIYTIYYKLWKPSIILLLLIILSFFTGKILPLVFGLGIMLFSGFSFSDWYEQELKKDKNVEFWGRTMGKNENEAKMKFFEEINKEK